MKISALVITKSRKHLAPWWMWNISKQTRQPDELIVVEASEYTDEQLVDFDAMVRDAFPEIPSIRIFLLPHNKITGESRQVALQESTGDMITWWDDDDYFSPNRLALLEDTFNKEHTNIAYVETKHHLDLLTAQILELNWEPLLIGTIGVNGDLARSFDFKPVLTGEDNLWLQQIKTRVKKGNRKITIYQDPIPGCILLHGKNTWGSVPDRGWDSQYKDEVTPIPDDEYFKLLPKEEVDNFVHYLTCFR